MVVVKIQFVKTACITARMPFVLSRLNESTSAASAAKTWAMSGCWVRFVENAVGRTINGLLLASNLFFLFLICISSNITYTLYS